MPDIQLDPFKDDDILFEEDGISSDEDDDVENDTPSVSSSDDDTSSGYGSADDEPGESRVEKEIEGDFERLVNGIRQSDGGSSAGMLSKEWDFSLEDNEAQFRDDLREASGIGKKRRKKKGRRVGPILSSEVRMLIGEGNQAYVDYDIPKTMRIMQEVIRIEPRAASAWKVLAQCHDDLKEPQKALQLRIMAAHLLHDAEEWSHLAMQSQQLGYNQQALYCFGKTYSLDPSNVNALWDRASLAKEIGELKIARNAMLAILKHIPHDLSVLEELRPILIELSDYALCASLFQAAFHHYSTMHPSGRGFNTDAQAEVAGGGFDLMELLVLADLYNTIGEYERAVETIRRGNRWLDGRAQQRFWDACEDDREFDVADGIRSGEGELQSGMHLLDVNARHRLAISRIRLGDIEEGKMHANIVLKQDIAEYAPLFGEIADAFYERGLYAEASPIYEKLGNDATTSSFYILQQTAACRRMVGDFQEAVTIYQHILSMDPTQNDSKMKLAEIYEVMNEPRKALELVLQVIDSRRRRNMPRQEDDEEQEISAANASLFEEKARAKGKTTRKPDKLTNAQLRELEARKERQVMEGYHRIKALWEPMLNGEEDAEREWLLEAEKIIESFRETRNLFASTRQQGFKGMFPRSYRKQSTEETEVSMASRLQLELGRDTLSRKVKNATRGETVNTFRTLSFDDWLRVFIQYSFLLTKRNHYDQAHEVLRHLLLSNGYQSRVSQDTLRIAIITCSIAAGRYSIAVEQSRKLINSHQFNNEPLRLLCASLASGLRPTDVFIASTLCKHILRDLRLCDTALKNKDQMKWNVVLRRYGLSGAASNKGGDGDDVVDDDDQNEEPHEAREPSNDSDRLSFPTKSNPIGVAIYGQICMVSKSHQSALYYLLHAYDYCPHDPLVCLSISVASLGRAMQRQADNRHHLIIQAMAFLSKYRIIRGADANTMDEVEFNFGRAFQQLGLNSLAVRHYERVLELAEVRLNTGEQNFGLAREAAYNLSLIYVTTGAVPLAKALYRRWLSL